MEYVLYTAAYAVFVLAILALFVSAFVLAKKLASGELRVLPRGYVALKITGSPRSWYANKETKLKINLEIAKAEADKDWYGLIERLFATNPTAYYFSYDVNEVGRVASNGAVRVINEAGLNMGLRGENFQVPLMHVNVKAHWIIS